MLLHVRDEVTQFNPTRQNEDKVIKPRRVPNQSGINPLNTIKVASIVVPGVSTARLINGFIHTVVHHKDHVHVCHVHYVLYTRTMSKIISFATSNFITTMT